MLRNNIGSPGDKIGPSGKTRRRENKMFCPNCGVKNPDEAKFCFGCGKPLPAQGGATPEPVAASGTPGSKLAGKPKNKVPKPVVIGGIVAAVMVIAIAVVVLLPKGPQVKSCLNDYSWEEIAQISKLISKKGDQNGAIEIAKKYHLCTADGKLDGTQTKDVTLSDGTQTKVMIMGFNHDDKSDGSGKAGITFIFADDIAKKNMFEKADLDNLFQKIQDDGSASISWENTSLRSWLSDSFSNVLPSDLSEQIVSVDKADAVMPWVSYTIDSYYGGGIGAELNDDPDLMTTSTTTTTSDKLWVPSYVELAPISDFNDDYMSYCAYLLQEGSQYQLFDDAGLAEDTPNSILGTYDSQDGGGWWLRSWGTYGDSFTGKDDHMLNPCFRRVSSHGNGEAASYRSDYQPYSYSIYDGEPFVGVRPAFCI